MALVVQHPSCYDASIFLMNEDDDAKTTILNKSAHSRIAPIHTDIVPETAPTPKPLPSPPPVATKPRQPPNDTATPSLLRRMFFPARQVDITGFGAAEYRPPTPGSIVLGGLMAIFIAAGLGTLIWFVIDICFGTRQHIDIGVYFAQRELQSQNAVARFFGDALALFDLIWPIVFIGVIAYILHQGFVRSRKIQNGKYILLSAIATATAVYSAERYFGLQPDFLARLINAPLLVLSTSFWASVLASSAVAFTSYLIGSVVAARLHQRFSLTVAFIAIISSAALYYLAPTTLRPHELSESAVITTLRKSPTSTIPGLSAGGQCLDKYRRGLTCSYRLTSLQLLPLTDATRQTAAYQLHDQTNDLEKYMNEEGLNPLFTLREIPLTDKLRPYLYDQYTGQCSARELAGFMQIDSDKLTDPNGGYAPSEKNGPCLTVTTNGGRDIYIQPSPVYDMFEFPSAFGGNYFVLGSTIVLIEPNYKTAADPRFVPIYNDMLFQGELLRLIDSVR